jgi:hypothetical protein
MPSIRSLAALLLAVALASSFKSAVGWTVGRCVQAIWAAAAAALLRSMPVSAVDWQLKLFLD